MLSNRSPSKFRELSFPVLCEGDVLTERESIISLSDTSVEKHHPLHACEQDERMRWVLHAPVKFEQDLGLALLEAFCYPA
jgi:hypothetical protein